MTLLNDTVTNTGATLQVDNGVTLTLSGTSINNGTINDFSASGATGGTIHVTGVSTIAGISGTNADLTGNGAGSTVQADAALTLDYVTLNDITLENGTAALGLLTIDNAVEVAGPVTLLNDTVTNTGATLQVDNGVTLTLSGTSINNGTINDFSVRRRRHHPCHRRQHDRRHQRHQRRPHRQRRRQYGAGRCRADA